jgi:hypothetical protein
MLDARYQNHAKRVTARRQADLAKAGAVGKNVVASRGKAAPAEVVEDDADVDTDVEADAAVDAEVDDDDVQSRIDALAGAPRPGVKPAARPAKRNPSRPNRPGNTRKRP